MTPTVDYMDKGFDSVCGWVEALNAVWEAEWSPGKRIIIDESMIFWRGGENVHLTWLLRKPTPMGICMKLAACDSGGVMLRVEVMESNIVDRKRHSSRSGLPVLGLLCT